MTNEERQAAKDALTAILQARAIARLGQSIGPGGMPTPPPGTEIDIDIDPNLLDPEVDMPEGDDSGIQINDPDNVLKDKEQNQKQSGRSKSGKGSSKSDGGNSNPGNPGGSSDSGSGSSDSGEDTSDKQGDKGGSKSDKGDKGNNDDKGDQGDKGQGDKQEDTGADYAAAWNEIIDRYDNDEITEAELQRLINEISRGNIDSI